MPSKEHNALVEQIGQLVYKAQRHRSNPNHAASEIISTILAALQEPTEAMLAVPYKYRDLRSIIRDVLAAFALGEKSE